MTFLSRPLTRQWGWIALALFAGFGAGNFHATKDAVDGSSQWWQVHEKRHLTAQQQADYDTCAITLRNFASN